MTHIYFQNIAKGTEVCVSDTANSVLFKLNENKYRGKTGTVNRFDDDDNSYYIDFPEDVNNPDREGAAWVYARHLTVVEKTELVRYKYSPNVPFRVIARHEPGVWLVRDVDPKSFGFLAHSSSVTPWVEAPKYWEFEHRYTYPGHLSSIYTITAVDAEGNAMGKNGNDGTLKAFEAGKRNLAQEV